MYFFHGALINPNLFKSILVNSFFKNIKNIPDFPTVSNLSFHHIIELPKDIHVHNFNSKENFESIQNLFSIGKYNEKRPFMYKGELFEKTERNIHMGLDIGAPIGTAIRSFYDGEIYLFKYNGHKLDYGYTLITKHFLNNQIIYALFGHLSKSSIENKKIGQKIKSGEVIGYVGKENENGGWPPHVHFQLCLLEPKKCDLPGVVSKKYHEIALRIFPDPRKILGQIY